MSRNLGRQRSSGYRWRGGRGTSSASPPGVGDGVVTCAHLMRRRGTAHVFPLPAVVPVPGNEFAMPAEDGIRSHEGGKLVEHLAPEDLAFDGQAPPLVVAEQDSFLSSFSRRTRFSVMRYSMASCCRRLIQPAKIRSKNWPWLKLRLHVPPEVHLSFAASGIVIILSRVERGFRCKTRLYSRLQLG
jgi:hypothetical protein